MRKKTGITEETNPRHEEWKEKREWVEVYKEEKRK